MYQAVAGSPAKRDMVQAIAKLKLSKKNSDMLARIFSITKPARDRRNEFAHSVWMITDSLPDALLLAAPAEVENTKIDFEKMRQEYTRILMN